MTWNAGGYYYYDRHDGAKEIPWCWPRGVFEQSMLAIASMYIHTRMVGRMNEFRWGISMMSSHSDDCWVVVMVMTIHWDSSISIGSSSECHAGADATES